MVPAGNKAKHLEWIKNTTKTIYQHFTIILIMLSMGEVNFLRGSYPVGPLLNTFTTCSDI